MGQTPQYPPPASSFPPAGTCPAPFVSGCLPVPPEVAGGFNWGAFWLTWIWGIAHNVWLSLLVFALPWPVMNLVLGIKGNEWAWQNRPFRSVQEFRDTQRAWDMWGWIAALGSVVLTLLLVVLWFALFAAVIVGSQGLQD